MLLLGGRRGGASAVRWLGLRRPACAPAAAAATTVATKAAHTAAAAAATTIYALATAPGKAGVAIVRISGEHAHEAVRTLTRLPATEPLPARLARLCQLRHPQSGELLDQAIVLVYPRPRSFTGEDVAELHVHGGNAVVADVLDALALQPGLRMAEAGEFTRRAFENGKLDLTQVEALADLVNAETAWQRRQALRHMQGDARERLDAWRQRLVRALAHVEAVIDFGESEEVDDGASAAAIADVGELRAEIQAHLADRRGEILRHGVHVAIMGLPNAGKSSLLNRLAGRRAAIVSAVPGTTRDVIEVRLNVGGYPLVVADTAGLRTGDDAPADAVESEGIALAHERIAAAALRLCVIDATTLRVGASHPMQSLATPDTVVVLTHADRISEEGRAALEHDVAQRWGIAHVWSVSNVTGQGMRELVDGLVRGLDRRFRSRGAGTVTDEAALITHARHRQHLTACAEALGRSLDWMRAADVVLAAEELRAAVRSLGRIVGRVDVEDLLDVIFRDFCIGK